MSEYCLECGLSEKVVEDNMILSQKFLIAVEALNKIKWADQHAVPCPDGREGCAVYHGEFGQFAQIARDAMKRIGEVK